jgi:hypothetical protein
MKAKCDIVVIDPFHLVPDTAPLPPGVDLVRGSSCVWNRAGSAWAVPLRRAEEELGR